jgi:hypothetical protein
MIPKANSLWSLVLPWCVGAVAAVLALRNLLDTSGDLGIYLRAARELVEGGYDLYRDRPDQGLVVGYPPVALLPFVALETWLDETTIRWIWCLSLGVATALILRLIAIALHPFGGLSLGRWIVFGVLFQRCIAQNLTHGQMSLWVAALMIYGAVLLQLRRDWSAGALLGAAAALKLTPLLFVPVLLLAARPRAALSGALMFGLLVYVVPVPFLGLEEHIRVLQDFHRSTFAPLLAGEPAAVVFTAPSHSIQGTIPYLLQPLPLDEDGYTANLLSLSDELVRTIKLSWSAMIALLLGGWILASWRLPSPLRIVHIAAATMMAIAFFSPLTRVYHLAGALLPFALFCRGPRGLRDVLWWGVALGALASLSLRQRKLIGEDLWRAIETHGVLHFTMVAMCLWLWQLARHDAAAHRAA